VRVDGIDPGLGALLDGQRRRTRTPRVDGELAEELAARRTVSVTELEQYATCSARWFIERRLRDFDPDDDRSRILDGLLAHALLQALVPAALENEQADVEQLRERALDIAPQLAARIDTSGALHPSRVERIVEHVVALVEGESDWQRPDRIDVERSFGRELPDTIGPGLDVDGVEVVGRIDRIDHYGSHVVLHDYKYGARERPAATLIQERSLQLLVYWLALQQPGSPMEPVGALYRAVTDGGAPSGVVTDHLKQLAVVGARKRTLDDAARDQLLDDARVLVHETVGNLRAGIVAPLDDPGSCPTHCRLQLVCRVGEGRDVP
jgi:ATP-dependent helicase/DNAse subunit B